MALTLTGTVVSIVATYVFLRALLHLTQHAREPPVVSASIPFIGPLLGMARHKSRFHSRIRDKLGQGLAIYTLRLPGARMYIVNSTGLIPVVQRLYRTVSFAAIEAQAATNICSLSKPANDVVAQGLMEDDSYTAKFASAIHPALAPGANLDAMNRNAAQSIARSLDNLQKEGGRTANLFDWVRDEMIMATTNAVYGPHNPLRDPEVLKSWWQFEPKVMIFALGMFPRIFARGAFNARRRITKAFLDYFDAGYQQEGSALIKCRHQHSVRFGFSNEDVARAEVGGLFAILGSTGPACFWMIYHLYSDPALLQDCRAEVSALVDTASLNEKEEGRRGHESQEHQQFSTIDITSVKTKCPVLLSTLQEVLRFRHIGVSARVVLKDEQLLDHRYHLKKGSMLIMPTPVYHSDTAAWGPTASTFDHRRFLPVGAQVEKDQNVAPRKSGLNKAIPRTAYRPFGGGHVLCPGRHFVTTEILAFATLLILRFDIAPLSKQGWKAPTIENSPMVAALPVPDDPIPVEIRPREAGRKWHVELVESDKAVGITVEDIESNT